MRDVGSSSTVNEAVPPTSLQELRLCTGKPTRGGLPDPQWDNISSHELATSIGTALDAFASKLGSGPAVMGSVTHQHHRDDAAMRFKKKPMLDYLEFCDIRNHALINDLDGLGITDYRLLAYVEENWLQEKITIAPGHAIALVKSVFVFGESVQ